MTDTVPRRNARLHGLAPSTWMSFVWLLCLFPPVTGLADETEADRLWSLTGFYGWFSDGDSFGDMVTFQADIENDYQFAGLALNRRLTTLGKHLDLEAEGQVVKHTEGQHHWEFNGLGVARWKTFPWDRYLDTNFAFGAGLSYATERPRYEIEFEDNSSHTLAYLLVEVEAGLPRFPEWSLVARIHHRSSADGTFNDNNPRSNALAFGVKYRF